MSEKAVRRSIRPQSSRRAIVDRINDAFETADVGQICQAIGAATRLYNISDLAHRSRLERQTVYRAFAGGPKHPNFKTVLSVLDAMGYQLQVTVRRDARARPARLKAVPHDPAPER
jgi:probable addiction module antidote protein